MTEKMELSWIRALLQGAIVGAIIFYSLYIPLSLIIDESGHSLLDVMFFALASPGIAVRD